MIFMQGSTPEYYSTRNCDARSVLRSLGSGIIWPLLAFGLFACEAPPPKAPSKFTAYPLSQLATGPVMLETYRGNLVVAEPDGTLLSNRTKLGAWEVFRLERHPDGLVSFFSEHGNYISADRLEADARGDGLSAQSYFTPEPQLFGGVAFRSYNGFYLSATPADRMAANVRGDPDLGFVLDRAVFIVRQAPPRETYAGAGARPPAGRVTIPGTGEELTIPEIRRRLADGGLALVQSDKIATGQCTIIYPKADEQDLSAEFGLLTCATRFGDNVTMQTTALYGGCDASIAAGAGAECSVGVFSNEVAIPIPNGDAKFKVAGPEAGACGSVTKDKLCANAGATIASTSFTVTDDKGNGIGVGVEAGVGAGLGGSYDEGILSGSVNLKAVAGGSISFSLNVDDAGEKVMWAGRTGYTVVEGHVVSASEKVYDAYANELGPEVTRAGDTVVAVFEQGGQSIVRVAEGTAEDARRETETFVNDVGDGATQVAEDAGKEVLSVTNKLLAIF